MTKIGAIGTDYDAFIWTGKDNSAVFFKVEGMTVKMQGKFNVMNSTVATCIEAAKKAIEEKFPNQNWAWF